MDYSRSEYRRIRQLHSTLWRRQYRHVISRGNLPPGSPQHPQMSSAERFGLCVVRRP